MEYYSAIKGNKIELSVVRWMDLESVIQSEVSQKEKQIPYANACICNLKKKNGTKKNPKNMVLMNLVAGQE